MRYSEIETLFSCFVMKMELARLVSGVFSKVFLGLYSGLQVTAAPALAALDDGFVHSCEGLLILWSAWSLLHLFPFPDGLPLSLWLSCSGSSSLISTMSHSSLGRAGIETHAHQAVAAMQSSPVSDPVRLSHTLHHL